MLVERVDLLGSGIIGSQELFDRHIAPPAQAATAGSTMRERELARATVTADPPAAWHDATRRVEPLSVIARKLDYRNPNFYRASSMFDKTLCLINHPERAAASTKNVSLSPRTSSSSLTHRGVGQALSLSRTACTICNDDTGFKPELVVVSPFRSSVETALLALPQYSPQSVNGVPWICHPAATAADHSMRDLSLLRQGYQGMLDYSFLGYRDDFDPSTLAPVDGGGTTTCKSSVLQQRAKVFLDWLQSRPERVIVGE